MIFNVFGDHIETLRGVEVKDITTPFDLTSSGLKWSARLSDLEEYHTCVTYVAKVRTQSGNVWEYDLKGIQDQLKAFKLSITTLVQTKE